ncbi:MAG: tetratricopeptide repeat protein [Chloroflexota bacterium]|nr:tetratricopeptide repeat protein [Chloroflexota bacterium]
MKTAGRRSERSKDVAPAASVSLVATGQLLVIFKIAIVVFAFDPLALDSFALTKSVVSHITAGLLIVVLLVVLARDPGLLRPTPIHVAMLALVLAFAAATPFALDREVALFGAWRRYLGLDQMLDHAVLFLGVATLFRTAADRGRLAFGLLMIAVPVSLYALLQWSGHDIVHYIENPGTRPIGTFGQPDTAGAFFGCVVACAAAAALWPWWRIRAWMRAAAAGLAVVASLVMLAIGTKGALLAAAAGLVALLVAVGVGRVRPRLTPRSAIAASAIGGIAGGLLLVVLSPSLAVALSSSGESRLEIWQTAVRAVAARPFLGLGPDNFVAAYPSLHDARSLQVSSLDLQNSTHSAPLFIATSAGIVGLLAWSSLLVLSAARALIAAARRDADCLVLVLLGAYVGQALVTITDLGLEWMPFVAAGIAASAWPVTQRASSRSVVRGAAGLGVVAALGLTAVVVLAQGQLTRLQASEAAASAETLRALSRPLEAVQYARLGLQIDNSRAEYWAFFGSALQDAGNPSAARQAYQEAAQRQPWAPVYWRDIALTYIAQGNEAGARPYLERAINADPYDVVAHDLSARLAFNAGDWQRALDEGSLAVRLYPKNVDEYEAPVRAAIKLQDWQRAEQLVTQALSQRETSHLRVLLALVYADAGRIADALTQVDRALALAPGDPEAVQFRQQIANR